MLKKLAILLSVTLFLSYCNNLNDGPTRPTQDLPSGNVTLSMDMQTAPQEVAAVKGFLARADYDTIFFEFEIKGDSATAQVEHIATGDWFLQVDAYDAQNNLLFTGNTSITVVPGKIIPVYLQLDPVNGGLKIIVTWGDANNHILAYFPFDSTLADLSPFHNNAQAYGEPYFTTGRKGLAIEFDGTDDFIQIPHIDAYNKDEKTIAFWFMKTNDSIKDTPGLDDVEGLVFKSYNTDLYRDFSFLIGQANPPFNFVFNVYNYGDSLIFLREYEIIQPNTWYHIAGVITEHSAKLYINGELVNVKEFAGQLYHNDAPITIGSVPPVDRMIYRYFKGKIDEFVMFDYALSSEKIRLLFEQRINFND